MPRTANLVWLVKNGSRPHGAAPRCRRRSSRLFAPKPAIEPVGPKVRASGGIDELSRDTHSVCRLANAPFQHVAYAKLTSDLLHRDRASLVSEARVAGDDEQCFETRQCSCDFFHRTVGEEFLLWIAAQVLEWQ